MNTLPALIRVARTAETASKALDSYLFENVEEGNPRAADIWSANYMLWQALQQLRDLSDKGESDVSAFGLLRNENHERGTSE